MNKLICENFYFSVTIDPRTLRIITEELEHNHLVDLRERIKTLTTIGMYRRVTSEHGSISQIHIEVTAE